jgi:hypothetical protein
MAAKLETTKTPGVYKRGSRYVFRYRVNGVQRWGSCRTLDEARRAKQARNTDIARGEFEERSRVTLHEYAREWVERHQGRGRRGFREGTRDEYRRQIETYVCGYFPERLKLTELTPVKIAGFIGWLCDAQAQGKRVAEERRAPQGGEARRATAHAAAHRERRADRASRAHRRHGAQHHGGAALVPGDRRARGRDPVQPRA